MRPDLNRLLDNEDLQNISRSYTLAYLKTKGITHLNFKPLVDNHWNLGPFEEGDLIRTDKDSLFASFTWPELTGKKSDISTQAIGKAAQEKFLDLIAHLILNNHADLPVENIELAFYINHSRVHHTCLLVRFEHLDNTQYKALYHAYQDTNNADERPEKTLTIRRNDIRNWLRLNQNIVLSHQDATTQQWVMPNWKLPLDIEQIKFRHIDSMGINSPTHVQVRAACEQFITAHKARFFKIGSEIQKGVTCGDWTVYNSFKFAVNKVNPNNPRSEELRILTENKSIENASEILFKNERRLVKVNQQDQVNIATLEFPQDYEAIVNFNETSPLEKYAELVKSYYAFNNTWPFIKWTVYSAALILAISFGGEGLLPVLSSAATFLGVNVTSLTMALGLVTVATTTYLFDKALKLFFGEKKLNVHLDKENEPAIKITFAGGAGYLLGIEIPYHCSLSELESELTDSLKTKNEESGDSLNVDTAIVHQYARKIINTYPDYFYDDDKLMVNSEEYVANKSMAKIV